MVSDLRSSLNFLESIGFMNVLLPFLFAFVVVFGILEKTKVFGTENGKTKKNINAMAAFVISFIFISFGSYVQSLITYLQILAMVLIFIMGLAYAFALFKLDMAIFSKKTFFTMILFIIAILAFFYSLGLLNGVPGDFIFELILNPMVLIVVFFFGLIWFMTSGDTNNSASKKKHDAAIREVLDKGGNIRKGKGPQNTEPDPVVNPMGNDKGIGSV